MRFVLEVSVDQGKIAEDTAAELGRILRYWGGNLGHYALEPGDGSVVYDSDYQEVGRWRIEQGDDS
ncbi:hypothetical protein C6N75_28095 [Streptomyces solincola]|uniref:Uncharacterized protein n=1 Tax=Streptomyces solincola TaxID=2100817 RepID=A0A2S9PNJ3_9ACTN|nr:hypothetical protein [Streptomyces solincola]PRH75976.1 hypothetical protein C6N75_28095 [Streptomyces solincola]